MSRIYLVVVRRPQGGPIHLANALDQSTFVAVCGAQFRGVSAVRKVQEWESKRTLHCEACADASAHARTVKALARIAGW